MKQLAYLTCTTLLAFPAMAQEVEQASEIAKPQAQTSVQKESAVTPSKAEVEIEAPRPFLGALISAYNTNPRLKAEREFLKSVDEGVATAISGFRPTASADFSYGRQTATVGNTPEVFSNPRTANAQFSQPLFRGGRTIYGYQEAKQRVKTARAGLFQTEQVVLFDAVNAYSDVFEKQSVLELNQNNVEVLRRQLEATQARFEVGELTRTDVAQAEARHAASVADLQLADGELKTSRATFEKVIGYSPDNLLPDSVIPELPGTLDAAIGIAEKNNPSLIAAKHDRKANKYVTRQAAGELLPEVSLNGSITRTRGSGFLSSFDNDSITVNVAVPLYQSGAEYARIRQAKNLHQQSKYLEIDTKNTVIESVTRAFEDYRTALSVIDSTAAAAHAADIAREGVREENEFGVRTILDVLDAEQELFESRVELVRAERNKTLQAYRLVAATGRLSASDLGLPVDIYDEKRHYNGVKWLPAGF